jgi:hypothetical protein
LPVPSESLPVADRAAPAWIFAHTPARAGEVRRAAAPRAVRWLPLFRTWYTTRRATALAARGPAAGAASEIAVFDFDNSDGTGCSFSTRILRLTQTTNATAIMMVWQQATPTVPVNITGFVTQFTKPVGTISFNNAQVPKQALASAPVTVRLFRAPDRDGAIDQQIVFHEFFHYVSNCLVGNAAGLGTNHAGGMGEGCVSR